MTIEKTVFALAGVMVMLTSGLAMYHDPLWTWVTVFVGFNMFQSTFTGICPPGWVMKKFGMKTESEVMNQN